jgi:Na+-driven multidrug efflux pump
MYSIGLSMGLMICFINVGSVALQTQINTFGDNIIVAHTAARKLTDFFMLPFTVLATAMATYCGQNLGAGKLERIPQGIRSGLYLSFGWCAIVILITYTIVPQLVHLVTGTKIQEIIDTASLYLRVDTLLYFVTAIIIIVRNAMQGIGDSVTPIVSSGIELAAKVAVAALLVPQLDYWAIILAEPISWVLMVIPLLIQVKKNPVLKGESV